MSLLEVVWKNMECMEKSLNTKCDEVSMLYCMKIHFVLQKKMTTILTRSVRI